MLKCRNCEYMKEIKEVTTLPDGQKMAKENQFYWILCNLSGIPETCNLDEDYPKSCEAFGDPSINSSGKKLCRICGTNTIDENGCSNLNHNRNVDVCLKKS